MKFFLFCAAMIIFCVLLYIPLYCKASGCTLKETIAGWSQTTNRDTKLYVLPDRDTTIHEPTNVCPKSDINVKNKQLLLVVVCSGTENFDRRQAIRQTWGNHTRFKELDKVNKLVKDKYKDYNFTYNLDSIALGLDEMETPKRDDEEGSENSDKIFNVLNFDQIKTTTQRVTKHEESSSDKILKMLKMNEKFPKIQENFEHGNEIEGTKEYQLVFLLGLTEQNDSTVQDKIEEEAKKYGDVIQEDFIDSYNNLTLKSIMMLKWISKKCQESVRYVLKADDDIYVNLPNLILHLQNRSKEYDKLVADGGVSPNGKEYLLIGALIENASPLNDGSSKWYSPRYMYKDRLYPKYVSGTGYLFSSPAAEALYEAALNTPIFHLEDIYITGICPLRSSPRVLPTNEPIFSFSPRWPRAGLCSAHAQVTVHDVPQHDMRVIARALSHWDTVNRCERQRLTQICQERGNCNRMEKYVICFILIFLIICVYLLKTDVVSKNAVLNIKWGFRKK